MLFVCSSCFLPTKPKLISQSQCVYRIVNPKEVFSVPCHFSAQDVHCCQESSVNTFTDFYPQRLTHQLFKVVCCDTRNGRNDAISLRNTAHLQRYFPVPPWHQSVFLKTVFVETFLQIRHKQTLDSCHEKPQQFLSNLQIFRFLQRSLGGTTWKETVSLFRQAFKSAKLAFAK